MWQRRELALNQCQYPHKTFPCLPFPGGTKPSQSREDQRSDFLSQALLVKNA